MEKKEAIYTLSDELSDIEIAIDKALAISNYLHENDFSEDDKKIYCFIQKHTKIAFDVITDYVFEARKIVKDLLKEQKNSPTTDQSK